MQVAVVQLLNADSGQRRIPQEIVIAIIDHVLENDHAQFIALVIELFRLYLDMLTKGVKAQPLHGKNIVSIALWHGRCENAVRPIALIQQPVEEIGLAIEAQAGVLAFLFDLQCADGKIRFDAILPCFQDEVIKVRIFRTP